MTFENAITDLESFWEPEEGVFWQLRQGHFVESEVERFVAWLGRFKVEDDAMLPRRLAPSSNEGIQSSLTFET